MILLLPVMPFRNMKFRLGELYKSYLCVPQPKTSPILKKQFSNHFGSGKRSFCQNVKGYETEESQDGNSDFANHLRHKRQSKEEIFEEISKGDQEILNRLKRVDYEIAFLKSSGKRAPDYLSKAQWEELLQVPSYSKLRKLLAFYHVNELKSIKNTEKGNLRRLVYAREKQEAGFHYYGLTGHTMFMRVSEKVMNRLLAFRSLTQPGLKVVFDCSYQEHMNELNSKACAKQISMCARDSKVGLSTCEIALCNYSKDSLLGKLIPKYAPDIFNSFTGPDIYEEDLLNVFPKKKLMYLTPHSTEDLVFDPDDIFVIGAFVDKGSGIKASLPRAKACGIRYARLPIDKYISWKQGQKSLPLNIVLRILMEMSFHNDWKKAFHEIGTRCIKEFY